MKHFVRTLGPAACARGAQLLGSLLMEPVLAQLRVGRVEKLLDFLSSFSDMFSDQLGPLSPHL